jgi:hypothetical protein
MDHGEVGGRLLHNSNGWISVRLQLGGHEQRHSVYAAILQGTVKNSVLLARNFPGQGGFACEMLGSMICQVRTEGFAFPSLLHEGFLYFETILTVPGVSEACE